MVANNLAFINLNSILDKVSQECLQENIQWKMDMSIILKIVKNQSESIPVPLQEDYFFRVHLPLLRSTLSHHYIWIHLQEGARHFTSFASHIEVNYFCHDDVGQSLTW